MHSARGEPGLTHPRSFAQSSRTCVLGPLREDAVGLSEGVQMSTVLGQRRVRRSHGKPHDASAEKGRAQAVTEATRLWGWRTFSGGSFLKGSSWRRLRGRATSEWTLNTRKVCLNRQQECRGQEAAVWRS